MGPNRRGRGWMWGRVWLLAVITFAMAAAGNPHAGFARQETDDPATAIRVVHGVAGAGPLDVYVDGAIALIGIGFGDASGDLALEAGDHAFAVVPSGGSVDAPIADGRIALDDGTRYYAALLGAAEEASVGLYAIDEEPVDAGRARFRVISGVADAGEITPAFSAGDALSEPLGFGDASQYAAIDAGAYDLDLLETATGGSLLSLPQTPFAEGTVTDVVLIGQVTVGTLQALTLATALASAPIAGLSAAVFAGDCGPSGAPVAELGLVQPGQGASVGAGDTPPVAQGFGLAPVSFVGLTETVHAVVVTDARTDTAPASPVACGEVGGPLTDTGALVIALEPTRSGAPSGVAVLAPSLENPEATGISIFLTGLPGAAQGGEGEPASGESDG